MISIMLLNAALFSHSRNTSLPAIGTLSAEIASYPSFTVKRGQLDGRIFLYLKDKECTNALLIVEVADDDLVNKDLMSQAVG